MTPNRRRVVLFVVMGVALGALCKVGSQAKANRDTFQCQANLKQIGLGLSQYQRDYDEKNVLAGDWKMALMPYTKNPEIYNCPSGSVNYALNRYLAGIVLTQPQSPQSTPSVFDSISTQANTVDFGTSYPAKGAHELWRRGRGTNVLFFDGHVQWLQQKPTFAAIKPLPTPLPPIIIDLSRVKAAKAR